MPKIAISSNCYTYCHDDQKVPIQAIDVHEVFISKSKMRAFISYTTIFLLMLSLYYFLVTKGQSSAWSLWLLLSALLVAFLKSKHVKKESVVIMPTFGVQLEKHYWSGRVRRRFVSIGKILKPVLNECVTPVTCYWSLALILRDENELMLVFQESRPPVKMLVPIWNSLCNAVDCNKHPEKVPEAE